MTTHQTGLGWGLNVARLHEDSSTECSKGRLLSRSLDPRSLGCQCTWLWPPWGRAGLCDRNTPWSCERHPGGGGSAAPGPGSGFAHPAPKTDKTFSALSVLAEGHRPSGGCSPQQQLACNLARVPLARITQISCSQIPDLQKLGKITNRVAWHC